MKRSGWRVLLALALVPMIRLGAARADHIRHPSGFTFALPDIGRSWEQEIKGDVIIVNDESDKLPELQVFVLAPRKEGTLEQIAARLGEELARPEVATFAGERIKKVTVTSAKPEAIADAGALVGTATANDDKAVFAIVQRKGRSVILVGIPKEGIFERGASNFRAIVHGLRAAGGETARPTAAPAPPPSRSAPAGALPKLPVVLAARDVTATSTFADPRRPDAYAPWRVIRYGKAVAADEPHDLVPSTAWCEGKPDEGVGEGISIVMAAPTRLDALKIAAGVWKSARLFAGNNQIASLEVSLDGKATTVKVPAERSWVEVPVRASVTTIGLKIATVRKGRMNDSCLSAVDLVRGGEAAVVLLGVDAPAADELPRALARLEGVLETPGRPALEPLLEFPFVVHDPSGFAFGAPRPVKHASWKALAAGCKAWDAAEAAGRVDESKAIPCPLPASVDPGDDRPAFIQDLGHGRIEVAFPGHTEARLVWRLHWTSGAWRLYAIDYDVPGAPG